MKIWHVVTEIPIPEIFTGGMGCHVWNVAKQQAALGHDVKVWCKIRSNELIEGVEFKPFVTYGPRFQSELALQQHLQWETAKDIAREADKEGAPDILHCHEWDSAAIVNDVSDRIKVPWITTLHLSNTLNSQHMTPHFDELVSYYLWWEQEMCRRSNAVIAISEYYRGWIKHFTNKPIYTILNGVNVHDFGHTTKAFKTTKKIAFFHGRLCMQKGLALIAEAAKKRDDIFWVIAGPMSGTEDGRCLEDWLLKELKELEAKGKISMPGMLLQDEIGAWLRACDVAVYPHLRAPFDCAVLEAMACGALVITTGVNAIAEYAKDGVNCRFCKPTAESLLETIDSAIALNGYCKFNAKKLANEFTWTNTTRKTLEVYERIINGNENHIRPECTDKPSEAGRLLLDQAGA